MHVVQRTHFLKIFYESEMFSKFLENLEKKWSVSILQMTRDIVTTIIHRQRVK